MCPPSWRWKWQDEMRDKFGLQFVIVNSELMAEVRRTHGPTANPFQLYPRGDRVHGVAATGALPAPAATIYAQAKNPGWASASPSTCSSSIFPLAFTLARHVRQHGEMRLYPHTSTVLFTTPDGVTGSSRVEGTGAPGTLEYFCSAANHKGQFRAFDIRQPAPPDPFPQRRWLRTFPKVPSAYAYHLVDHLRWLKGNASERMR